VYYRKLLLAIGAILIVIIFFETELYSNWYNTRLSDITEKFSEQYENLDYEARREYRWQGPYDLAKFIRKTIGTDTNEWVIIPPPAYMKIADPKLFMPEPITLYYYTGVKAAYPESAKADSAKFAVIVVDKNVKIVKITDSKRLEMLRLHYAGKLSI
jgi:hypothetical protein